MIDLKQRVTFHSLATRPLAQLLHLERPVVVGPGDPFSQLNYIESYVKVLGCRCVALESHYIDRDYMEDHSVFYSRSLYPFKNYCRRLHFFSLPPNQVKREIARLRQMSADGAEDGEERKTAFLSACREFSKRFYIGFCVVKPLPGCPVGRTVVACYPPKTNDGAFRRFDCTREYHAHFAGLRLTVRGLAFQQQDVGVSACATTAIWSAINKVRDFEDIGNATPASITGLAARHTLPFGRAMPSEGLSIDQMCQAIQALGISPDLMRVSDGSKRKSQTVARIVRGYLYSATKSGIAPILIIKRADGSRHAVTTTGMRLKEDYDPAVHVEGYYDEAMNMHGLYVHDDRVGPNVRADLQDDPLGLKVRLRTFVDSTNPAATIYESWDLTHILLPMHAKIRFSFGALSDFALEVLAQVGTVRDFWVKNSVINATADVTIRSENWLALASGYIESLLFGESTFDRSIVPRLTTTIPLPRYVGIVRFRAAFLDPIDVIVDTTSTRRNLHCVAVLPLSNQRIETLPLAGWLAGVFKTQVVP